MGKPPKRIPLFGTLFIQKIFLKPIDKLGKRVYIEFSTQENRVLKANGSISIPKDRERKDVQWMHRN